MSGSQCDSDQLGSLPEAALRAPWHLACIRGPHQGIIALPGNTPSQFPAECETLSDSSHDQRIRLIPRDESSQISVKARRLGIWRRVSPSCTYRVGPALKVKVRFSHSTDFYVYRARPRILSFPDAVQRRGFALPAVSFIGFLPIAVFMGVRISMMGVGQGSYFFLAALPLAVILFSLGLRYFRHGSQGKRLDAAAVALVLQVSAARSSLRFALYPSVVGRGKPWLLEPSGAPEATSFQSSTGKLGTFAQENLSHHYYAALGPQAQLMVFWFASQIATQAGGAHLHFSGSPPLILGTAGPDSVHIFLHGLGDEWKPQGKAHEAETERGTEEIHLAWAYSYAELPTWCEAVIPADKAPVSLGWWQMITHAHSRASIPNDCDFTELFWDGIDTNDSLRTPIGQDSTGEVSIDLVSEGPHALIAGTTGSGKSEALRTWLLGLCARYSPTRLRLVLVDYKGGSALAPLVRLPHTEAVLTDLDPGQSARALRGLASCLAQRENDFAKLQVKDLQQWYERYQQDKAPLPPPRILIVVDEFRVLADLHPTTMEIFSRLASQGRSLGLHLLYATQHPSGAVNTTMRANTELRIALRTITEAESLDIIGSGAAARIPRIPGRAIIGSGREVQFAYCHDAEDVIRTIRDLCFVDECQKSMSQSHPLWCPPLPSHIPPAQLKEMNVAHCDEGVILGLRDGIDTGTHCPLVWQHGNILFSGVGSSRLKLGRIARSCAFVLSDALGLPVYGMSLEAGSAGLQPGGSGCESYPFLIRNTLDLGVFCEAITDYSPCVLWIENIENVLHSMEECFGVLRAHQMWGQFTRACDGTEVILVASEGSGTFAHRSRYGSFEHNWCDIPSRDIASNSGFIGQAQLTNQPGQLWNPTQETMMALPIEHPGPKLIVHLRSWDTMLQRSMEISSAVAIRRPLGPNASMMTRRGLCSPYIHRFPKTPLSEKTAVASRTKIDVDMHVLGIEIRYGSHLKRFLFSEHKCILIGDENSILASVLKTINPSCSVDYFEQTCWLKALSMPYELLFFPNPPGDALRIIAQSCQDFPSSLYAHSWNSYSGVIIHHGSTRRFVLSFK